MQLSVIVPVFESRRTLRACLEALLVAAGPDDEIVLADDGSTDGAVDELRTIFDARVTSVRSPANIGRGPIRDLGTRSATREILVFIDSDVVIAPDALDRIRGAFAGDGWPSAVIGSYSDEPTGTGRVSDYRNLLHHFTHHHGGSHAGHFWTGIGAIRRELFIELGGFGESLSGGELEDVAFGHRLIDAGHDIEVLADVQGQHLKRYSVRSMVRTDLHHRAVPWSHLMLDRGFRPDRFVTSGANTVSAIAAVLLLAVALSTPFVPTGGRASLLAGGALVFATFLAVNIGLWAFFLRTRGAAFMVLTVPLHLIHSFTAGLGFAIACVQRTVSGDSVSDRSALVGSGAAARPRWFSWHGVERRMRWVVGVWLVWVVVAIILVMNHEAWRDELQAWSIVRSASDPLQVIERLRGEGHPPSWYLLLWPLAKISPSIVWLKVVSVSLGASSAWMILRNFPVSFGARVLLIFGYFPLFELTAISRSYGLVLLLVLLIMGLAERRRAPDWVLVALLLVLAGTHALAVPIAMGIAISLWGGRLLASPSWARRARWALGVCAGIGALAVAFIVWSAGDGSASQYSAPLRARIGKVLLMPQFAASPTPQLIDKFWRTTLLPQRSFIGVAVAVLFLVFVRRSASARTLWAVSLLGITLIAFRADRALEPRFVAVLWVAGLAAVWFAAVDRRTRPIEERSPFPIVARVLVAVVLFGSFVGGVWATSVDIRTPFSGAERAAQILAGEIHGPAVVLCATYGPGCSSVAIRLDLPAYMSADGEPFTFVVWKTEHLAVLPANKVRQQAGELARRTGAEVLIVSAADAAPKGCGRRRDAMATISISGEDYRVCSASSLIGTD